MLGIRNGHQPQLDCEHDSPAYRGRSAARWVVVGDGLVRQQTVVQHMRALPHGAVADALATVRTC